MAAKRFRKLDEFGLDADLAETTRHAPVHAGAAHLSTLAVTPSLLAVETGTPGPDTYNGTDGDDIYFGGKGRDVIHGQGGDDRLSGGAGDDIIRGGVSNIGGGDRLSGGDGDDQLIGNRGDDLFRGGKGADLIDGDAGINTVDYSDSGPGIRSSWAVIADLATGVVYGGEVAEGDRLQYIHNAIGSGFPDILFGSELDNRLSGGDGNDSLLGMGGDDLLFGGGGNDFIHAGEDIDHDLLYGGEGDDNFTVSLWGIRSVPIDDEGHIVDEWFMRAIGEDRIMDFILGEDRIQIEGRPGDPYSGSFADLDISDVTLSSGFSGALISFGTQGSLLVRDVAAADFTAADIIVFYP